jgi:hypothetical protein
MACVLGTDNLHGHAGLSKPLNLWLRKLKKERICLSSCSTRSRLAKLRDTMLLSKSVSLLTRCTLFLLRRMFRNPPLSKNKNPSPNFEKMNMRLVSLPRMDLKINTLILFHQLCL